MEGLKCVQWDSHTDHVKSLLQDLMITNNFADVTLVCEDLIMLRAHRNILSAGSQVLRDIFLFEDKNQLGGKQSVIHLRGVKHAVMQAILEYIYLGETAIPLDGTNDFLLAAIGLGVRDCIPNSSNDQNLNALQAVNQEGFSLNENVNLMEMDLTTKSENKIGKKEYIEYTTTPMKLDKTGQITNGFSEAISSFKPKEELVMSKWSTDPDLEINSELKEVNNQSNLKHQCSKCSKVLKNAYCLKKHESNVHVVSTKFPCEICAKSFANKASLSAHVMNIHERRQWFYCEQCDYKSVTKYGVQNHILAKHDKVQFECGQCDNKYSYLIQLKRHKETVHEGARFFCDSCSFQAAYKSDINVHKKIVHEGIRRKCDDCDYQSKHPRELRNHMKNQHKKNVSFKRGVFTQLEDSNSQLNSSDTGIKDDTN